MHPRLDRSPGNAGVQGPGAGAIRSSRDAGTKKSAGTKRFRRTSPVELRGLEPLTPCMPCRCATSCATAPDCCCPCGLSSGSPPKQLKYLRTAFPKIPNREYSPLLAVGNGAGLGGRVVTELQVDDGAVLPETLQRVEHAVFLVLDMDHDVGVVQQDPSAAGPALAAHGPEVLLGE